MSEISSYSKVYSMGHRETYTLLDDDVFVEEKVDGSQFSFANLDGTYHYRSKGAVIYPEAAPNLFAAAVDAVASTKLPQGIIFRGECLNKPRHNVLAYNRVPNKHVIIFDVESPAGMFLTPADKEALCASLGFETVPLLTEGRVRDKQELNMLLSNESCLGGQKVEGIVIKPKRYDLYDRNGKVVMGKIVAEAFKELHHREGNVNGTVSSSDIIVRLSEALGLPSRWRKAIQRRADKGELLCAPEDIGPLMRSINEDVFEEEEDYIKEQLYKWAKPQLQRGVTKGFPEWYKALIAEGNDERGGKSWQ